MYFLDPKYKNAIWDQTPEWPEITSLQTESNYLNSVKIYCISSHLGPPGQGQVSGSIGVCGGTLYMHAYTHMCITLKIC